MICMPFAIDWRNSFVGTLVVVVKVEPLHSEVFFSGRISSATDGTGVVGMFRSGSTTEAAVSESAKRMGVLYQWWLACYLRGK